MIQANAKHNTHTITIIAAMFAPVAFFCGIANAQDAVGQSAAGIVRTDVASEGAALIGVPFHPFGDGRPGDVLQGDFSGGNDRLSADSVSFWFAESQSWSNAWFDAQGEWRGLEEFPFVAGDAFWFLNRQTSGLSVFVKGGVPFDEHLSTLLFPGLNLVASPFPTPVEGEEETHPLGAGFWILSDEPSDVSMLWQSPYFATGGVHGATTPRITGIDINAATPSASVLIDGGGKTVDILSLTVDRLGAFAGTGWSVEARVVTDGLGEFWWDDDGFAAFVANTNNTARFYLVGDASIDSVGDGISDVLRVYAGSVPTSNNDDSEADADDGLPLFLFLERFEADTVTPGPIGGQNGWVTDAAEFGEVQADTTFAGNAALRVGSLDSADSHAMVSRAFTNAPEVVWIDMRQIADAVSGTQPEPHDTAAAYYFDSAMRPVVLDGGRPAGSRWVALADAPKPARGEWVRMTMRLDYGTRTWDLYLNGAIIAEELGFATEADALRALGFEGALGFYDDVFAGAARPAGLSADGNGIPDDWEIEHFGSFGQDPHADPDGDGLTNYEEWLAGTDPLDADADGDGLPDGWEVANGLDPLCAEDAAFDHDGDGIPTGEEYALGLDPFSFNFHPAIWQNGVDATYMDFETLSNFPPADAVPLSIVSRIESQINYPTVSTLWQGLPSGFEDSFASVHEAFLFVPESGSYEFNLMSDDGSRLWIDGALVIDNGDSRFMSAKRAQLLLPHGMRHIRVEHFENMGNAGLILKWRTPGSAECVIPAESFYRLVGNPDLNDNGIHDWWEALYGVSDPDADPDGDGLTNLEEFLAGTSPTNPSTGGGNILDGWNVANDVNPFVADNGAYSVRDGLSNFEKQLYGIGPWDKRFTEIPQTVKTIRPIDADDSVGSWYRNEEAVGVMSRKGDVLFTNDLEIATPGIYQIMIHGNGRNTQSSFLACEVDGISLGVAALSSFHCATSSVAFYTQWLPAGTHLMVLNFDNIFNGVKFAVTSIDINAFGGDDADENELPDWVDARLAANAVSRPGVVQSKVSPYCMTGTTAFFPLVEASVSESPLVVKPLPRKGWWANVPLDISAGSGPSAGTPVTVSYENGAVVETVSVEWAPFCLFYETDTVIRSGDSLLLAAHPEFATTLSVDGGADVVLAPGQTVPFLFTGHKTYAVSAHYEDGGGAINSVTVKVTSVRASMPEFVPVWQGKTSTAYFDDLSSGVPGIPSNFILESPVVIDSELEIAANAQNGNGRKISFVTPKRTHPKNIALIIPHPDASVLDSAPFAQFYAYYTVDGIYHVVNTLPDGTHVVENRLTTGKLPEGVTMRMRFHMPGICFDDGALEKTVDREDLDAFGELDYFMYTTATHLCHYIEALFNGKLIAK